MKIIFLLLLSESCFSITPNVGYVYNTCSQNNNLNIAQSSGGTLYMSAYDQNSSLSDYGLMNNTHIINCSIGLQVVPQGSLSYQRFLGIHFRLWNYDTNSAARYNKSLTNLTFPNQLSNIRSVCGDSCLTGCMQIVNQNYGIVDTICATSQLTGVDYQYYFQENLIYLRFYLLGGLYSSENVTILGRSITNFIIDYFSFYFGTCMDTKTQLQCINTDRCIDIDLKCDAYGGMDCGIPSTGNTVTYDQLYCTTTTATPLLALLALLGLPLFIMLIIWLFYRPGLCCWRCARLRNCRGCNTECYRKCCIYPIIMGTGSRACRCCRGTTLSERISGKLCPGVCSCCNGEDTSEKITGNFNKSNDKSGENEASFGWENYAFSDGYHLRECR